jgi:hypothetical protein
MVGGIFGEIEEKESCDCIPSIVGGIFGEIEETTDGIQCQNPQISSE